MFIEMQVEGFGMDALAKMPVVILKALEGETAVPVYIAPMEAVVLATGLVSREISRGERRTDLFGLLMERLGVTVERVSLDEVKDRSFTASVHFRQGDNEIILPVKTVDALLASMKYKLPVFVCEEAAKAVHLSDEGNGRFRIDDPDRYAEFLQSLDPSDMGKYPM
jgi:uncharacterized protein